MMRDPSLVAHDVWNGKITADYAQRAHGIVIDPDTAIVDSVKTAQLRGARQSKLHASW
jgi:N-methylhydantoinase B/oxoprolinase/acetone carboxylase alpha subunit